MWNVCSPVLTHSWWLCVWLKKVSNMKTNTPTTTCICLLTFTPVIGPPPLSLWELPSKASPYTCPLNLSFLICSRTTLAIFFLFSYSANFSHSAQPFPAIYKHTLVFLLRNPSHSCLRSSYPHFSLSQEEGLYLWSHILSWNLPLRFSFLQLCPLWSPMPPTCPRSKAVVSPWSSVFYRADGFLPVSIVWLPGSHTYLASKIFTIPSHFFLIFLLPCLQTLSIDL